MKFTFNEVINIYTVLNEIVNNTFKVNYWISRNKKVFEETFVFIVKERQKIYEEFLSKDEKGEYYSIADNGIVIFHLKENTDEYSKTFSDKMKDLFSTDCELEPYIIDVKILMDADLSISLNQLEIIRKLYRDE